MKVLLLNGGRLEGNSSSLALELIKRFPLDKLEECNLNKLISSNCTGCCSCFHNGGDTCYNKSFSWIIDSLKDSDIVVISTPTYGLGISGKLKSFMDYLAHKYITHQPIPELFDKIGIAVSTSAGYGEDKASSQVSQFMESLGINTRFELSIPSYSYAIDSKFIYRPDVVSKIDSLVALLKIYNYKGKMNPELKSQLEFFIKFAKDTYMFYDYNYLCKIYKDLGFGEIND